MMRIDSSNSTNPTAPCATLFGRQRPMHSILGGGKVADVLLWKDKRLSAATLAGATVLWFLFEVVEYNFVTLLCHTLIIMMLTIFVWYNGAGLINRNPTDVQEFHLSKSTLNSFFVNTNWFLMTIYDISRGRDLKLFVLVIASLWILSAIGTYFSSLNLLYLGFVCMERLPVLYEQYQKEVDYLASRGNQDVKKLYKKIDSKALNKIPRGPVKEKKFK